MEWLLKLSPVLVTLITVAGAFHAVHAVLYVRSSQGAIAWAISLVTFPYIAMPLYWIFGRRRFKGYAAARRAGHSELDRLAREVHDAVAHHAIPVLPGLERIYKPAAGLTSLPFTGGNDAELLINGRETFEAMLNEIRHAEQYILIQFFIVRSDRIGTAFKDALVERARAGVKVRFLYDEVGSRKLGQGYLRDLRDAGAEAEPFRSTKGPGNRFQLNFRNHRKILIVDGRKAFAGGLNMGDEYLGEHHVLGPWRDTHVQVEGPAVQCMQLVFAEDWHWATGRLLQLEWTPKVAEKDAEAVLVLPTGPSDPLDTFQLFFVSAIQASHARFWAASAYFVPDPAVVTALQLAALRGVDVRILLPDRPDHLLVYLSAFSYYHAMLSAGVKLYRYREGFMHQKVLLLDDVMAVVGTANLDNRSFHLNFEVSVAVPDPGFTREVAEMLEKDFEASRLVKMEDYDNRPLWFKAAVRVARLTAPVQ